MTPEDEAAERLLRLDEDGEDFDLEAWEREVAE